MILTSLRALVPVLHGGAVRTERIPEPLVIVAAGIVGLFIRQLRM